MFIREIFMKICDYLPINNQIIFSQTKKEYYQYIKDKFRDYGFIYATEFYKNEFQKHYTPVEKSNLYKLFNNDFTIIYSSRYKKTQYIYNIQFIESINLEGKLRFPTAFLYYEYILVLYGHKSLIKNGYNFFERINDAVYLLKNKL
jgi:hypothetical protein